MKNPRVTVLMSVFNGERFLRESIESILNQTFEDFEFLIVNDGSTDASPDIIKEYAKKDPRIKPAHQENIGLTRSLNKGLKLAKGKYIARMDADDISDSKRLETQAGFLDAHTSIGVVGINSYVIDERGNIIDKVGHPESHDEIRSKILSDNKMVHSSIMLRKNLLETNGYYNEEFHLAQDYDLLLRLSVVTELANLPEPLHSWRENRNTGISMTRRQDQIVVRDIIREDFLIKHYAPNKNYISLVLSNYKNKPDDTLLLEYIKKILNDISFVSHFFLKLTVLYYVMEKESKRCLKGLLGL